MSSQSHPTPTANTKANNQHNGTRKTSTLSVAGDQPTTSNDHRQTGRAEVKLNVYDMVSMANFNQYSSPVGFGVFHSGVEIYGSEYAYGGHDNSHSGVFDIAPRDVSVLGADSFKFRQTILLGYTDITEEDVKQIIDQLGVKFRGDKYHLLHQNCNHFTDALTKVLCGQGIPPWINRLAQVSSSLPFLERWLSRYMPLAPNDRDFPTELRDKDNDHSESNNDHDRARRHSRRS